MLSLINIAGWFGTLWGRVALGAGLVASLLLLRAADKSHQQGIGAAKVVEASKENGAKANEINRKVRVRAAEPGAADRLRRDPLSCRDCR